jgi:hypothetical protein
MSSPCGASGIEIEIDAAPGKVRPLWPAPRSRS